MTGFWASLGKSLRRPKKTALEAVRKKKKEEAVTWAQRYYADARVCDTAARFVIVLESQIGVPIHQFSPLTRFLEDLAMDDLEPVEVVMAVEEEFEIPEISDCDGERLTTIDAMIRYLAHSRDQKKA
jgi:acyl carrier protein